ncbi:MAG TPA: DUF1552 domain-containing protein [Bryobacteraceae bacterium]|nr:DUF1552 domain-containing protein [Bryobacteraceae bacterium]
MIITQKHLSRRTLLRGIGTSLALPLLDAMIPAARAESATAAAPVRRLAFIYYPLGVVRDGWYPKGEGANYELSEALKPLEPHKDKFLILTGLSSDPDRTKTDFHDRAMASFMTGCELTPGRVHVGTSVDQIAAKTLGKETQLASLELSTQEMDTAGGPIYKDAETPLPLEINPRNVFERLFGDGSKVDAKAAAERQAIDQSRLDSVLARIAVLKRELGPSDRHKMDEYLESIRDIERRIQVAMQKKPVDIPGATRPPGIPDTWAEHMKLMFDLQVIAAQADLTRVWTFMYGCESSYHTYPELGITMQHHEISHHNYDPVKLAALHKINVYQSQFFAYFLSKMESVKEGNSSLLDHSLILYGSDLSNPTIHSQRDLPIILAGGAAGRVAGGRHIHHEGDMTPLTNLYLTMLDKVGVPTEKLGDSTGPLKRLEV